MRYLKDQEKLYFVRKSFLYWILILMWFGSTVFASGVPIDLKTKPAILEAILTWVDDNLAYGLLTFSIGGAIIANGDLRVRTQGAGMGFIVGMIVWGILKTMVGFKS